MSPEWHHGPRNSHRSAPGQCLGLLSWLLFDLHSCNSLFSLNSSHIEMTMSTTSQSQQQPRPTSSTGSVQTTRQFKPHFDYDVPAPDTWPNNAASRRRRRRKEPSTDTVPLREALSRILASDDSITLFPHSSESPDSRSSSSDGNGTVSRNSGSNSSGIDRKSRSPRKDSPALYQGEQKEAHPRQDSS